MQNIVGFRIFSLKRMIKQKKSNGVPRKKLQEMAEAKKA